MKEDRIINWDDIPDTISKEQLCKICHISKKTAFFLLTNNIIPNEDTGKKTFRFKIKKEDVMIFVNDKVEYSDKIPQGYYKSNKVTSDNRKKKYVIEVDLYLFHQFFEDLLAYFPDLMSIHEISVLTGYGKTAVLYWCSDKGLPYIISGKKYFIPKNRFITFCCGDYFPKIKKRSYRHFMLLNAYKKWLEEKEGK